MPLRPPPRCRHVPPRGPRPPTTTAAGARGETAATRRTSAPPTPRRPAHPPAQATTPSANVVSLQAPTSGTLHSPPASSQSPTTHTPSCACSTPPPSPTPPDPAARQQPDHPTRHANGTGDEVGGGERNVPGPHRARTRSWRWATRVEEVGTTVLSITARSTGGEALVVGAEAQH